jgi:hypothetical protein
MDGVISEELSKVIDNSDHLKLGIAFYLPPHMTGQPMCFSTFPIKIEQRCKSNVWRLRKPKIFVLLEARIRR